MISDTTGARGPVIAVIGGGASGTLATIHLLRVAAAQQLPLSILLIDEHGRHGLGQAYATTHPEHLLNAPASQMSALAGEPDDLIRWAGAARTAGSEFLPRRDYGRYLRDTLAEAERHVYPLCRVTRTTAQAVALRRASGQRPLRLVLSRGCIDADVAILATGNQPAALPCPAPPSPRIITDPWAPGALAEVAATGGRVLILGTGLTMLDAAIAVTSGNSRTRVQAVSRHGWLPRSHSLEPAAARMPVWLPVTADATGPVRLAELIWQVRSAMSASPGNWQEVVDAIRPATPGLWQRMPLPDKRAFLCHVARHWEIHRHRMPPGTARLISQLRCTGRLAVRAGQVSSVSEHRGTLQVSFGDGEIGCTADWLINATGPAGAERTAGPLQRDLFASGLARPDPLGLGIDAGLNGAVLDAAGPSTSIFTLGPPLRGIWYESTAIPEIREQAAALARQLTTVRQARRPGSAA